MMVHFLLAAVAGLATPADGAQDAIAAARQAIERRAAWSKGAVDFTWDNPLWAGSTRFYTGQFTRGERLLTWHGDAEGVLARDSEGRPRNYKSSPFGPVYTLDKDDAIWEVQDVDVNAHMWRKTQPAGIIDVRSLGLTAGVPLDDPAGAVGGLARARPAGVQEGRHVYVLEEADGRTTWWLDPHSGWLPVRVTREHQGRIVAESRSTLENRSGVWFPAQVEFFDASHMEGKLPKDVIHVSGARFDTPDLPDEISLEDVGVDAGVNVFVFTQGQSGMEGAYKWDGRRPITTEEYRERWERGELRSGPIFQRNWNRISRLDADTTARYLAQRGLAPPPSVPATENAPRPLQPLPDWESEWERYVREFCEKYRLSSEQRAQADRLLSACRKLGHEYLARKRFAFDAFERAHAEFLKLNADEQARRRSALERQRLALVMPLREIFDERLKPGLDKLPTREQRRVHDGQGSEPKTP